ncbi:MAG: hypothetical protein ACFE8B_10095 [Candidatus Hermodarchaeota archaeon]
MVWGGSLNKEGSDYLRNIRKSEEVIQFLEKLIDQLSQDEQDQVKRVIQIIADFISKLSEKGK